MGISVSGWGLARRELSTTDIEYAEIMATAVMKNVDSFLKGQREYFRSTFVFDDEKHEKALEFFLPMLRALDGYAPDDAITVSEDCYEDYETIGSGDSKQQIKVVHNVVKLRQKVLSTAGKSLVAECVDWAYDDAQTGLRMGHPYAVNYFGLLEPTADQA